MNRIFSTDMVPMQADILALLKATKGSPFEVEIPEDDIAVFLQEWHSWLEASTALEAGQGLWHMLEASADGKKSHGSPSICWTAPDAIASMYETAVTSAVTATRAKSEGKSGFLVALYRLYLILSRICICNLMPPFANFFFGGRRSSNHLLLSLTAYLHIKFDNYYSGTSNLGIHLLFIDAFGAKKAVQMLKAPAGTIAHQFMMAYMAKGQEHDTELMLPISQVTAHLDFWLQTGILALLPDCLTSKATAAMLKVTTVSEIFVQEWNRKWPQKAGMMQTGKSLYQALQDSGRSVARQDSGKPGDFYALFPAKFMCMASEIGSLSDLHENVVIHGIKLVGCGGYLGGELGISEVAKLVKQDCVNVVKIGDGYVKGKAAQESKFTIAHELDSATAASVKAHYLKMVDNAQDEAYVAKKSKEVEKRMDEEQQRLCAESAKDRARLFKLKANDNFGKNKQKEHEN